MPSGANFFYDLFKHRVTERNRKGSYNFLGLMAEGLNSFIVQTWCLEKNKKHFCPEEWKGLNVEDVFSFLDVGSRMLPRGSRFQKGLKNQKANLYAIITSMLAIRCDGMHDEILQHVVYSMNPEDSIISFNWDTIVDHTIKYCKSPMFANYAELMNTSRPRVINYAKKPVLLKLHGSLNWYVCENRGCELCGRVRIAIRSDKLLRFFERGKCPSCGKEAEPFIVPPTTQKFISRDSILNKLWLIALEKLSLCKRLIFIGYSFPKSDFYSEWLFRHVHLLENVPEIIVVNPDYGKQRGATRSRYDSIFRGCRIVPFSSLEEFEKKGLLKLG